MFERALSPALHSARAMVMTVAIVWLSACIVEEPTPTETGQQLDCQKGYYEVNGQCVIRPDVVFITMEQQVTPNTVSNCPRYTPNPVSVRVGQNLMFRNTTTHSHTVYMGSAGTPLFTVAPGQTSPAFSVSQAGTQAYWVNCGGHSTITQTVFSTQQRGSIIVTVS
jgi:hypothetical protein